MRLLSRLEYERSFGARWGTYLVRIPKGDLAPVEEVLDYLNKRSKCIAG
jgi:hypothetical protein